jgi:hypothetical protein
VVYTTSDGTLMAAPFDTRRLEVTGPPMALVAGVRVSPSEVELELARAALDRYSVAYQRADARLVRPHTRRSVVCSP